MSRFGQALFRPLVRERPRLEGRAGTCWVRTGSAILGAISIEKCSARVPCVRPGPPPYRQTNHEKLPGRPNFEFRVVTTRRSRRAIGSRRQRLHRRAGRQAKREVDSWWHRSAFWIWRQAMARQVRRPRRRFYRPVGHERLYQWNRSVPGSEVIEIRHVNLESLVDQLVAEGNSERLQPWGTLVVGRMPSGRTRKTK